MVRGQCGADVAALPCGSTLVSQLDAQVHVGAYVANGLCGSEHRRPISQVERDA